MARPETVEILLVEDNDSDAELTLRALQQANLFNPVRRLSDGQEALDYLFPSPGTPDRGARPRLILLDLKLPMVSGLEVLRAVKAHPATRSIPVVVLSSSSEERDIAESYQSGANSYIVKPVEFDKFMTSVQKLGVYWLLLNQYPTPP